VEHRRQTTSPPRVPEWSREPRRFRCSGCLGSELATGPACVDNRGEDFPTPEKAILGALDNFVISLPIVSAGGPL